MNAPDPSLGTAGRLVFGCIAPHGDLAIAEACPPERAGLALATQSAMVELGRRCAAHQPEALVLLTPHGIHVEGHLAVAVAGRVAGALDEAPAVALDVPVDRPLAAAITAAMRERGLPVVAVSFGGNDPAEAVMPLDWGSLIPLWYLGGRERPPVPVVLVAPARDLSAHTHVEAGRAIADAVARTGRLTVLVASADQSHTHSASGPYGHDPAAGVLDTRVRSIVERGALQELLGIEPALIEAAKPDSWWQLLMLLGATGGSWRAELLSYEAPTYYGMLCAAFEPSPVTTT